MSARRRAWARAPLAGLTVVALAGLGALAGRSAPEAAPVPEPAQFQPGPIDWEPCAPEAPLECAWVEVPLDHADPDGPRTSLRTARLPATGTPAERVGSLFLNPGGPGASAIDVLAAVGPAFADEVRAAFDVVALNPRGVEPSEPSIACSQHEAGLTGSFPAGLAAWQAFFDAQVPEHSAAATACQLAIARTGAHYGTNAVVEDLEWLRRAVGDEQLTYWGISYGTRIGEVYAQRHPDRVRAMVLDGSVDPTADAVSYIADRGGSFDDAFSFLLTFFPEAGPAYDTVAAAVAAAPMTVTDAATGEQATLTLVRLVGEVVIGRLPSQALWPGLVDELVALEAQVEGGPPATVTFLSGTENDATVLQQVNCLDLVGAASLGELAPAAVATAAAGPRFGAAVATGLATCTGFPLAVDPVPTTPPASIPPLLLLGSLHDPSTPYEWSERMRAFLAGSVLVTYEGAQHGLWNIVGSDCIDDLANAYVLDLDVPPPGVECAFVPLGAEAGATVLPASPVLGALVSDNPR